MIPRISRSVGMCLFPHDGQFRPLSTDKTAAGSRAAAKVRGQLLLPWPVKAKR